LPSFLSWPRHMNASVSTGQMTCAALYSIYLSPSCFISVSPTAHSLREKRVRAIFPRWLSAVRPACRPPLTTPRTHPPLPFFLGAKATAKTYLPIRKGNSATYSVGFLRLP
jgi:hypothetical protein